jgi:hypothetical protein
MESVAGVLIAALFRSASHVWHWRGGRAAKAEAPSVCGTSDGV